MKNSHLRQQLRTYNAIYKETDALYSELARRSGLSDCAFWLLYSLRDTEGICRQKDICGQWTLSKQTVNSALKGLESQGLIILQPETGNAKSKRILLTDKGNRFAEQHIDPVFELEQRGSPSNGRSGSRNDARYQPLLSGTVSGGDPRYIWG